ncbi:MAG: RNA methyltransferase [Cryomorphaceae bacterium]|nr:RNA methyltransferase [Flavobacteriales bacterium]
MNTKLSLDALNRPNVEEFEKLPKQPVHVILDNVRSAQNVGSIFRTMDAFRCARLHLCGITPAPPHREINKTALGATASVPHSTHAETIGAIKQLRSRGLTIYAVEQTENSIDLAKFERAEGVEIALIFGNEVEGVDQSVIDACDGSLEISQFGTKHSLNIAVCAGIVLWQIAGIKLSEK